MFDFRRATVVCSGHRFLKHKMAAYAKNLGRQGPWSPWMRLSMLLNYPLIMLRLDSWCYIRTWLTKILMRTIWNVCAGRIWPAGR